MWPFRRRPPTVRCRTVWMRKTATGYHPWLCDGIDGDGHRCVAFVEGHLRNEVTSNG